MVSVKLWVCKVSHSTASTLETKCGNFTPHEAFMMCTEKNLPLRSFIYNLQFCHGTGLNTAQQVRQHISIRDVLLRNWRSYPRLWLHQGNSPGTECHQSISLKQNLGGYKFEDGCEVETVVTTCPIIQDTGIYQQGPAKIVPWCDGELLQLLWGRRGNVVV